MKKPEKHTVLIISILFIVTGSLLIQCRQDQDLDRDGIELANCLQR
jgi:hypothetical protein